MFAAQQRGEQLGAAGEQADTTGLVTPTRSATASMVTALALGGDQVQGMRLPGFHRTPRTKLRDRSILLLGSNLLRWMRRLGGFDQPAAVDRAALPLARAAQPSRVKLAALSRTLPETRRMLRNHLCGGAPENPETTTPTQARARYGKAVHSA